VRIGRQMKMDALFLLLHIAVLICDILKYLGLI